MGGIPKNYSTLQIVLARNHLVAVGALQTRRTLRPWTAQGRAQKAARKAWTDTGRKSNEREMCLSHSQAFASSLTSGNTHVACTVTARMHRVWVQIPVEQVTPG